MKTQWMTDWQILAVTESVRANPELDAASKAELLELLDKASHVRVSYPEEQ
jgi:hypothetical protein